MCFVIDVQYSRKRSQNEREQHLINDKFDSFASVRVNSVLTDERCLFHLLGWNSEKNIRRWQKCGLAFFIDRQPKYLPHLVYWILPSHKQQPRILETLHGFIRNFLLAYFAVVDGRNGRIFFYSFALSVTQQSVNEIFFFGVHFSCHKLEQERNDVWDMAIRLETAKVVNVFWKIAKNTLNAAFWMSSSEIDILDEN